MRAADVLLAAAAAACFCPAATHAQVLEDYDYENLAFRGVGIDYGRIFPDKVKAASMYSLRIDLGYLGPGLRIVPSFSYWSSQMRDDELERLANQLRALGAAVSAEDLGPIDWSDLSLSVDGTFVWTTPIGVFTYVGGGVGLHALNGQGVAIENTFVEDLLDSIAAGFAIMAGLEFQPIQRLRVYGEARYALVSDVRYPALRIGAALMLPPRAPPGAAQ